MTNDFAQQLRKTMTGPELTLWREVRKLRQTGFIIRRQAPFGRYVVDFVSHQERLVIEVDGITHTTRRQQSHDAARTNAIEARGYLVIRFTNDEVLYRTYDVLNRIKQVLVERRAGKFTSVPLRLRADETR
ncbi:MAG: endonuclease domain-containing protein [Alphaproteobacteria bacterium]|nr:endonuclease domain-containing protein [Alphaproteobacteria bacterium]